jgi:hypothetical protein
MVGLATQHPDRDTDVVAFSRQRVPLWVGGIPFTVRGELHDFQLDLVAAGPRVRRHHPDLYDEHLPQAGRACVERHHYDLLVRGFDCARCVRRRPVELRRQQGLRLGGSCRCFWLLSLVSSRALRVHRPSLLMVFCRVLFMVLTIVDALEALRSRGHNTPSTGTKPAPYAGA